MQKIRIIKSVIFASLILLFSNCNDDDISSNSNAELVTIGDNDYRPVVHFSPDEKWMNDPNGMVYYDGEYHLFFQHNPNASVWGPMHWGHAISTDLVNWQQLPIALYPDDLGNIFSGSIVVDANNTSGFKTGNESPLVAIFTHQNPDTNGQTQSLAYSNDKGRSWTKYTDNPVLVNSNEVDFRDPKVFWHETTQKWVMVIAAGDEILFYSSSNLKDWEYKHRFGEGVGAHGGVWECPDLFKIEDENGQETWALLVSINPGGPNGGSGTQYFLGDFDGETFTSSQDETLWLDYGTDNYAGVTWSNEPSNRNLFIGWMSNWVYAQNVPTYSYRSSMTFPRTLHWKNINGQNIIASELPTELIYAVGGKIAEVADASSNFALIDNETLKEGKFYLETTLDFNTINKAKIEWGNISSSVVMEYNKVTGEFLLDRSNSGYNFNNLNGNIMSCQYVLPDSNKLKISMLVDKSSMEIFLNDGERVITTLIFPLAPFNNLEITANEEIPFVEQIKIHKLSK
ncbi:MAG: glycoside hydrolase family 32 protein [Flavobacteriaceae bacterium]|nr:glycoside hydrolase family 32 protein [Mangrovimonas sp.]MCB0469790.1 glycoside hydrolase family 32 protein [Flavobacteriaceae bacterium]MCB0802947.1 glycoside hydrolase family 32 protein [Flavobacteriales bacterium]MCB0432303.1 glycoside hydrolase family 32 protein [Mangrovimonas sp.]MCB0434621.1 glycoside hydrolase family 32 protein [Mangrovimonas sp.]